MAQEKEDYYVLLGVERTATFEAIKKAYRKKAVQYHPDKHPGDKEAEEMFKKIGEAYGVLKDPEKRAAYDRYGHDAFVRGGMGNGGMRVDPFDIFREVFGGVGGGIFENIFGGGAQASGARKGADLYYEMEISLEEAARGCEREVSYKRRAQCRECGGTGAAAGAKRVRCPVCGGRGRVQVSSGFFSIAQPCPECRGEGSKVEKPCPHCGGSGLTVEQARVKVKVPAGVDTGVRLRVPGGGEAGGRGGPAGDLYVVFDVKPHDLFEREGDDLFYVLPIKFTLAVFGGTIRVPTLEGDADLKIPAGTQTGTSFRLREKGMPKLRGSRRGDLVVRAEVVVPKKLNAEQRAALEAFAKACGDEAAPVSESFLEKAKKFFG